MMANFNSPVHCDRSRDHEVLDIGFIDVLLGRPSEQGQLFLLQKALTLWARKSSGRRLGCCWRELTVKEK